MPKVSVVVAAYNEEEYIRDAIDSILGQTYDDFELVVVDDGSEDRTPDIIRSFSDDRLRVIRQNNAGFAAALNCGIETAQGQYIANLDADDFSLPRRLQKQVEFLDAHPGVGIVGSFATVVDTTTGNKCRSVRPLTDSKIKSNIAKINPLIHSTVMLRREVIERIGDYDTCLPFGVGYEYWIRAMKHFRVANIPEVLVVRREHPGSMTYNLSLFQHQIIALRLRIKAIKSLNSPPRYWLHLLVPIGGIALFRLGFNKEFGYRVLFPER